MNELTKKLKEKLRKGEISYGSWITIGNPIIAELMANHVSPVKAVLAEAREYIKQHVQENPWRPYIP